MKTILFVLTLTALAFAQHPYTNPVKASFFTATADSVRGADAGVDTVKWQVRRAGGNWPATWNSFSTYITAANKTSEQTLVFPFANESAWTYGGDLRFAIYTQSGSRNLTSGPLYIGNRLGALTLFIELDTLNVVGQDTSAYYKSYVEGQ